MIKIAHRGYSEIFGDDYSRRRQHVVPLVRQSDHQLLPPRGEGSSLSPK